MKEIMISEYSLLNRIVRGNRVLISPFLLICHYVFKLLKCNAMIKVFSKTSMQPVDVECSCTHSGMIKISSRYLGRTVADIETADCTHNTEGRHERFVNARADMSFVVA